MMAEFPFNIFAEDLVESREPERVLHTIGESRCKRLDEASIQQIKQCTQ